MPPGSTHRIDTADGRMSQQRQDHPQSCVPEPRIAPPRSPPSRLLTRTRMRTRIRQTTLSSLLVVMAVASFGDFWGDLNERSGFLIRHTTVQAFSIALPSPSMASRRIWPLLSSPVDVQQRKKDVGAVQGEPRNHQPQSTAEPVNGERRAQIDIDAVGATSVIMFPSPPSTNGAKPPPAHVNGAPQKAAVSPPRAAALTTPVSDEPVPPLSTAPPPSVPTTTRSMWRRRNARSAEEGIRREKTTQLSTLFAKASSQWAATAQSRQKGGGGAPDIAAGGTLNPPPGGPRYAARTLAGLIHALAEEADDLEVRVDARSDTPLWGKSVEAVRIQFSRLGFKPLKMGGFVPPAPPAVGRSVRRHPRPVLVAPTLAKTTKTTKATTTPQRYFFPDTRTGAFAGGHQLTDLSCADEAFERIDVDNSGALDADEIADALTMAASAAAAADTASADDAAASPFSERRSVEFLRHLASELVALYDFNGDGVVDRTEYQSMVEDMAALRDAQEQSEQRLQSTSAWFPIPGWMTSMGTAVSGWFHKYSPSAAAETTALALTNETLGLGAEVEHRDVEVVSPTKSNEKAIGSITFSDLKLDLRRLVFGAIPILKHIMPGGPLILEPFTATIVGSFNRDDIKNSFLLDAGLRRLVAQALKRRVRSLRDFMDGAVFHGRSWKMSSESAPSVQVLELTDIEFDDRNKLILTGRVRVQPRQEVPVIENSFKLRTRIGTRRDGRFIRLVEPELALVLECPKSFEQKYVRRRGRLEHDCGPTTAC